MEEKVLKYIQDFGYITTWEAFTELGCTRLSEYIRRLRKRFIIESEWISSINRYGEKIQYKKYWIKEN